MGGYVLVCLSLCVRKEFGQKSLNGDDYDIGWDYASDYDVYSLQFVFIYSTHFVIWQESPSSPQEEQALKSARSLNGGEYDIGFKVRAES